MASHADILTTANYATLLQTINDRLSDLARGADPENSTVTNYAVGGIRWSSASNKWQKNTGTQASPVWSDLATTYAISISGNAGTATTLQNARTINGVSFNGSANITVTANTGTALTFNNAGAGDASGTTFNGSAARTISYNTVGAPSTTGTGASGNWGINITGNAATVTVADDTVSTTTHYLVLGDATSGADALKVSSTKLTFQPSTGNFTAAGNVTAYSDIRIKEDIRAISDALYKVQQIGGYTYRRTDTGEVQAGVIAQEVRAVLPEVVSQDDDGRLSVAYGNLAALLIQAVKELAERVEQLEAR